jgi:NodT family efflux transporter outer membrane factor (OMF) lipoprotein
MIRRQSAGLRTRAPLLLASLASFLHAAACRAPDAAPPAKERAPLDMRESYKDAKDPGRVADDWLSTFGDARLDALVAEAGRNNPDLAIAAARRDRAAAEAGKADAALSPKLDAVGGFERGGDTRGTASSFNLGLSVSWEADVWGRLSNAAQAAALDAVAAQCDYEFARQSIAAKTAQAWFLAIAAKEQVALDSALLAQRERVARVVKARHDVGEAKRSDLDTAEGQAASARQSVEAGKGVRDASLRSLEALLGRYPSSDIETASGLPALPVEPPVGLPSELLERRPDVVAADRRVAAAFGRVGSAKAAKLPRLALTAGGGQAGGDLASLFDPANAAWNLGANLLGPLFDGGEREAAVRIAQAAEREALAGWIKTAQRAFLEVETALANERVLRSREVELAEAATRLLRARDAMEERYKDGESSILDVDQAHANHAAAAKGLLQVRQELFQQRINLHLALGGSFEAVAAKAP